MTIGPEPITRMRWRSARRAMNQVVNDVVHSVSRGPARRCPEFPAVANQYGYVHRPHERRIDGNLSGPASALQDSRRDLVDREARAAGDVVDLARLPVLQQHKVRGNDVADMKVVAH